MSSDNRISEEMILHFRSVFAVFQPLLDPQKILSAFRKSNI